MCCRQPERSGKRCWRRRIGDPDRLGLGCAESNDSRGTDRTRLSATRGLGRDLGVKRAESKVLYHPRIRDVEHADDSILDAILNNVHERIVPVLKAAVSLDISPRVDVRTDRQPSIG